METSGNNLRVWVSRSDLPQNLAYQGGSGNKVSSSQGVLVFILHWALGAGGGSSVSATTAKEVLKIYNVFHMSQPHKCIPNVTHVIELEPLQLREDLTNED